LPLDGGGLDEGTNAPRELRIDDANRRRRFLSYRGTKLGCRRPINHPNAFCSKHRNDLVQTITRGVRRDHRELKFSVLCRISHPLNSDDHESSIHANSEQPEQLGGRDRIHA
jgi:hypothetical protein